MALVAQMVERKTLNLVVVGSSPTEGAFFLIRFIALKTFWTETKNSKFNYEMKLPLPQQLSWRSWQRVGLIIPRSPVRARSKAYVLPDSLGGQDTALSPRRPGFDSRYRNIARLAQSAERKTLNLVVVGSSPTVGILFCFVLTFSLFLLRMCQSG